MGLRKSKKIKDKIPKGSISEFIQEKTPDPNSSAFIKHKTPDSSSKLKGFGIPPPRQDSIADIPKEEPFIPSREGFRPKKSRKEEFVNVTPPIILEDPIPNNERLSEKKFKTKEPPNTSSVFPPKTEIVAKQPPSRTGKRNSETNWVTNQPLPPKISEKTPGTASRRIHPTTLGSAKSKAKNRVNRPPPVTDKDNPIPKDRIRRLPPTLKSKKNVNRQPPHNIKSETPGKQKKPPRGMKTKIPKKIVNKRPPQPIRSKSPSRDDKSQPPPTYKEEIPKTIIKQKNPR
ncbi:MAG: hypothetical protein ACFFE8_12650 [Candidatus Heimdallarchaeota archaeon]